MYERVKPINLKRSRFDLSNLKMGDCNIGAVYPVTMEFLYPSDIVSISHTGVLRAQALIAPIFHRLNLQFKTFIVPLRLIFEDAEKLITGGPTDSDTTTFDKIAASCISANGHVYFSRQGFWDTMGLPMHNAGTGVPEQTEKQYTADVPVADIFWRALWAIWRDYYRDEHVQPNYPNGTPVGQDLVDQLSALDTFVKASYDAGSSKYHIYADDPWYQAFKKDFFTSALPRESQASSPVSIPLDGSGVAEWATGLFQSGAPTTPINVQAEGNAASPVLYIQNAQARTNVENMFNDNDLAITGLGIDIGELRMAMATQEFLERNIRAGYRYGEQVLSRFRTVVPDFRLGKPLMISSNQSPVVISEVLQQSETNTTPQGTLAGHGMAVSQPGPAKYKNIEHSILVSLMTVMPDSVYQQGIPKQFSMEEQLDLYAPEFDAISEQPILCQEIYFTEDTTTTDLTTFGYQQAWDHLRTRRNTVVGSLAADLNYWTLSRVFAGCPSLNEAFLTTENLSKNRRDAWALSDVQNSTYGQFFYQVRTNLVMVRPLPYVSVPQTLRI